MQLQISADSLMFSFVLADSCLLAATSEPMKMALLNYTEYSSSSNVLPRQSIRS